MSGDSEATRTEGTGEVRLTDEERGILAGRDGPAASRAMELLVALARIHRAPRLVRVRSVQVSGVSYHNLGDAGLEFLQDTASTGRVRVPIATLNPAGMDLRRWREQSISQCFAEKQKQVVDAYARMGIVTSCTCTPYLAGNLPTFGEHIAWAESSAVTFANSVIGARTNREGGPAALAAALVGRTPYFGLHTDEGRAPTVTVEVGFALEEPLDWGLVGALIAWRRPGCLPLIRMAGGDRATRSVEVAGLKALAAALPTFGAQPMFHLVGHTPEADRYPAPPAEQSLELTPRDREEALARLNDDVTDIDLVCLGCPHATFSEVAEISELLGDRRATIPLWICVSRAVAELVRSSGLAASLEERGATLVCDTCFVVAPLKGVFSSVATDSAKGCYYSRGHNRLSVRTATRRRCVDGAVTGRLA